MKNKVYTQIWVFTRSLKLYDVYKSLELIFPFKYTIHKYITQVLITEMMKLFNWWNENKCLKFHPKAYDTRHLFLKDERLSLNCNKRGMFSKSETLGIYTLIILVGISIIPWISALIGTWNLESVTIRFSAIKVPLL